MFKFKRIKIKPFTIEDIGMRYASKNLKLDEGYAMRLGKWKFGTCRGTKDEDGCWELEVGIGWDEKLKAGKL